MLFKNKKLELKMVDAEPNKNKTTVVEEGIRLNKREILTAVVVLTLVNGLVATTIAKAVSHQEDN